MPPLKAQNDYMQWRAEVFVMPGATAWLAVPYQILMLSSGVWWSLLPIYAVCDVTMCFLELLQTTFWRSLLTQPWAQLCGGDGGRVPPLFQTGGHNIPCPPTFFSLGFVIGEVSKVKVMFVTFYVKSFTFSC